MKKILLGLFLVLSFVLAPSVGFAQANPNLWPPVCTKLTINTWIGKTDANTGGQVTRLQNVLIENGYLAGPADGLFGPITRDAVRALQLKYKIVPAAGLVGQWTRALINYGTCVGVPPIPFPNPIVQVPTLNPWQNLGNPNPTNPGVNPTNPGVNPSTTAGPVPPVKPGAVPPVNPGVPPLVPPVNPTLTTPINPANPNPVPPAPAPCQGGVPFNSVTGAPCPCGVNSPASIRVVSPNGGEIYALDQKVTIAWETCNPTSDVVRITLVNETPAGSMLSSLVPSTGNDGTEVVQLSQPAGVLWTLGKTFRVRLDMASQGAVATAPLSDLSDTTFTIQ